MLLLACASVSSAPAEVYPPGAAVDVTQPPYRAIPDDGLDDTRAIQAAISDSVETGRFLYFPAGTYLISDTLVAKNREGIWRCRLVLAGESRDNTILRLADSAPGFGEGPKPLLATGSQWEPGDSLDGGGNKAFGNYILNLSIQIGKGNPGAIGVEYAVSNFGAIQDVTITSEEGPGVAGIAMKRRIPGPGLISRVKIRGFDVALDTADLQYGLTIEDLEVSGQRVAGIRTNRNLLHVRGLKSTNEVPAVQVTDRLGVLTLLDSKLVGGRAETWAIESKGTALTRNISIEGYKGTQVGQVTESSPLLPIEETPLPESAPHDDWEPVGARCDGEPDDTQAIQRAIDSGKSTVYFINDRSYFLSDTVTLRGNLRRMIGFGSEISLGAAEKPFSDRANPRPLFRIDPKSATPLFLEHLFFNAQYPGELLIENHSPGTVVIRHCAGWVGGGGYRRSYRGFGKGKLFLEDLFLPGWEFSGEQVWARQFNPENYDSEGSMPQVSNAGSKLWILGFKTEGAAPFITTSGNGTTELLGAYNYISATKNEVVPQKAVPYRIENSKAALTFATDNFRDSDYPAYISITRDGKTLEIPPKDLPPRNGVSGDRSIAEPLFHTP